MKKRLPQFKFSQKKSTSNPKIRNKTPNLTPLRMSHTIITKQYPLFKTQPLKKFNNSRKNKKNSVPRRIRRFNLDNLDSSFFRTQQKHTELTQDEQITQKLELYSQKRRESSPIESQSNISRNFSSKIKKQTDVSPNYYSQRKIGRQSHKVLYNRLLESKKSQQFTNQNKIFQDNLNMSQIKETDENLEYSAIKNDYDNMLTSRRRSQKKTNNQNNENQQNNFQKIIEKNTIIKIEKEIPFKSNLWQNKYFKLQNKQFQERKNLIHKNQKVKNILYQMTKLKRNYDQEQDNIKYKIYGLKNKLKNIQQQKSQNIFERSLSEQNNDFYVKKLEDKVNELTQKNLNLERQMIHQSFRREEEKNQTETQTSYLMNQLDHIHEIQVMKEKIKKLNIKNEDLNQKLQNKPDGLNNELIMAIQQHNNNFQQQLQSQKQIENLLKNVENLRIPKKLEQQKEQYSQQLLSKQVELQKINNSEIIDLKGELNQKNNEIQILELKLSNSQEKQKLLQDDISKIQKDLNDLKIIEMDYFNQIKQLEGQLDIQQDKQNLQEIQFERQKKDSIQNFNKLIESMKTEFNQNHNEQEETIKLISSDLHSNVMQKETQKNFINKLKKKLDIYQQQSEQEIEYLNKQILNEKEENDTLKKDLENQIQEQKKLKEFYSEEIKNHQVNFDRDYQEIYQDNEQLVSDIHHLTKNSQLNEKDLKKQLEDKLLIAKEYEEALQKLEKDYQNIQSDFMVVLQDNQMLTEEREILVQNVMNAMSSIDQLRKQIKENEEIIQEFKSSVAMGIADQQPISSKSLLDENKNLNLLVQDSEQVICQLEEDKEILLIKIFHISLMCEMGQTKKQFNLFQFYNVRLIIKRYSL